MTMMAEEARSMQAFVQGGLMMSAQGFAKTALTQPVEIDQPADEQGNYEPYFLMKLASGIVLRVSVSVETY